MIEEERGKKREKRKRGERERWKKRANYFKPSILAFYNKIRG